MKRILNVIVLFLIVTLMSGCELFNKEEEKFVTFSYNDSVYNDYKCKIENGKINCMILEPENDGLVFMGWYDENDNKVDLDGTFKENITLHPKFLTEGETQKEKLSAKKYTITFDMNGGSGSIDKVEVEYEGELYKLKNLPKRSGYVFLGFYDSKETGKGKQYYNEKGESVRNYDKVNNTTLYAIWSKETRKEETPSTPSTPSTPTTPSTPSTPSTPVEPPKEEKKYTITFNINGGSGTVPSSVNATYGSTMPNISGIPTRSGYTFMGWYDNTDWTKGTQYYKEDNLSSRTYNKTSNITLYAGWEKKEDTSKPTYTIAFNLNSGNGTAPSSVKATNGSSMPNITSTLPSKTGYTFMGWYDNSDYTKGKQYYTDKNKSARSYDKKTATTLYAGWKANTFTVSYNSNGGSGTTKNIICTYDKDCKLSSNGFTRSGYIFTGWKKGNTGSVIAAGSSIKNTVASGTVTYYAQWSSATYTVSFNINNGSGTTPSSVNATYGSAMPSINGIPSRTGYTFMGWYDNADYTKGTEYYTKDNKSARTYNKYAATTLYAGWRVNIYTVSFNINNGSGTVPSNVSVAYDTAMPKITISTLKKEGYTFQGWYDNTDWTKGKKYYNADGTSARPYDKASNATLYAGWKINRLFIQYNGNTGYWNIPSSGQYAVNQYGTVILNNGSNSVYTQIVNYGSSLSNDGLINHNGKYFNWTKKDYGVRRGQDYIIKDTNITLDQDKSYSAIELANYVGCNLSIQDCLIQVKVNYVKPINIQNKKYYTRYSGISGFKGYPQNFAIANFDKSNEILYVSAIEKTYVQTGNNNESDISALSRNIISKFENSNGKTSYTGSMYLESSGHGQAFDYDIKRNIFILNDYKDTATYGDQTFGSSKGLMGITFDSNNKKDSYKKIFTYNLDVESPMPIIDADNNIFGTVCKRVVKIYNYDYNSLITGNMNFNNPKIEFIINRQSPVLSSQGFAIYDGFLYELSGVYGGDSYVEVFDLYGKSIYKVKLENGYVAKDKKEVEGIKIYNNNIYINSTYEENGTRKIDIGYYN